MSNAKRHDTFDAAALADLLARDLPPMRAIDCFSMKTPDSPDAIASMAAADEYLKHFVFGERDERWGVRRCICCGAGLTGFIGAFQWGLAFGEGHCRSCGYPARGIHKIDGVGTLDMFVLQYHPSGLSFGTEKRSAL